jgi:hypothetical protein
MKAVPLLLLLLGLPTAAVSQSAPDGREVLRTLPGLYGSATDPSLSCEVNPHRLAVTADELRVVMEWDRTAPDPRGGTTGALDYTIIGIEGPKLTLRLEVDNPAPSEPGFLIRTLRQTGDGYCWTRPDWPAIRCEDPQLRCDAAAVS